MRKVSMDESTHYDTAQTTLLFENNTPTQGRIVSTDDDTKQVWQRQNDDEQRRLTIAAIILMFRRNRMYPMHDKDRRRKIHRLAQKLELALYRSASSLEEYINDKTLERRVHHLVTKYKNNNNQASLQRRIRHVVALYRQRTS